MKEKALAINTSAFLFYIQLNLDINGCQSKFLLRIHSSLQICQFQGFFAEFSKHPIRLGFMSSVAPSCVFCLLYIDRFHIDKSRITIMPTIIALRTINAAYKTPFSGFNTMILRFILILQA